MGVLLEKVLLQALVDLLMMNRLRIGLMLTDLHLMAPGVVQTCAGHETLQLVQSDLLLKLLVAMLLLMDLLLMDLLLVDLLQEPM